MISIGFVAFFAKCDTDLFYSSVLCSNPEYKYLLICLAHIVVTLLLTMLVFRFKKIKAKGKKRKKGGEEIPVDPEIKEILEQSELTEGIVE